VPETGALGISLPAQLVLVHCFSPPDDPLCTYIFIFFLVLSVKSIMERSFCDCEIVLLLPKIQVYSLKRFKWRRSLAVCVLPLASRIARCVAVFVSLLKPGDKISKYILDNGACAHCSTDYELLRHTFSGTVYSQISRIREQILWWWFLVWTLVWCA